MSDNNVLLSQIFLDSLIQVGLEAVCISPGSRSTPLTIAAWQRRQEIEVYSILDERSAAFLALGIAKASKKPVALICTSGSALVNYMPAVVEASQTGVPLIILSADRPHRLRKSGANQTIDQIKIYGGYCKEFFDMPPPTILDQKEAMHIRSSATRGYAESMTGGVVHFNFPFDKPLENREPLKSPKQIQDIFPAKVPSIYQITQTVKNEVLEELVSNFMEERGVIIFGPIAYDPELITAGNLLSRFLAYPILADPLSNIRTFSQLGENVVSGAESLFRSQKIQDILLPKVIIQVGASVTSKYLLEFISRSPSAFKIQVGHNWADEFHSTDIFLPGDPKCILNDLLQFIDRPLRKEKDYLAKYHKLEEFHRNKVTTFLEREKIASSFIIRAIQSLPNLSNVFAANSLTIRNIDQFLLPLEKDVRIYGNRGVSGIDGNISTASGISLFTKSRMDVLFIGDLAFLHDLNALLSVHKYKVNLKIVVLNNSGGGIFRRLPISKYKEVFDEYFLTPQEVSIKSLVEGFGVRYRTFDRRKNIRKLIAEEVLDSSPVVIEINTDSEIEHSILSQFLENYIADLERIKLK